MNFRTSYHHGHLRESVLDLALDTLERGEAGALSLRALARQLGVSATAVYRHFRNKDDLLAAVAERGFDRLAERFETARPITRRANSASQAVENLQNLGSAYLEFALKTTQLFRFIFSSEALQYRSKIAAQSPASGSASRISTYRYLQITMEDLHRTGAVTDAPNDNDVMAAWALIHGYANLLLGGVALHTVGSDIDPDGRRAEDGTIASRVAQEASRRIIAQCVPSARRQISTRPTRV